MVVYINNSSRFYWVILKQLLAYELNLWKNEIYVTECVNVVSFDWLVNFETVVRIDVGVGS